MRILIASLLIAGPALAKEAKVEYAKAQPTMTKLEALRILINNPQAVVYRCVQQEITDRATLRNKKKTKK